MGEPMEFSITRFVAYNQNTSLKAFCDVAINRSLLIKGIRIVEGRNGPFVSMPRQKGTKGDWHDSVVPLSKELKDELHRLILETYHHHKHSPRLNVKDVN